MRRSFIAGGIALMLMICVVQIADAQTPPSGKPLTITKDMVIQVPADQPLVYEYTVDVSGLQFATPAEREKYFSGLKDEIVSYRFDSRANTVTLLLDKSYIEKNKWQAADINHYFAKRAAYMKQHYEVHEHPDTPEK